MSIAQARQLIAVRRWEQARDALAADLADPQAGAQPWLLLAECELHLGDVAAGRDAAGRGLALAPEWATAHQMLAVAELQSGRLRPAQDAAQRALALAPDSPGVAHTMVAVLLRRRRFSEAEAVALHSLERNPEAAVAWESAATVSLRRSRWAEGEQRARAALSIDPQDTDVMLLLGVLLQAQDRQAEAGELYAAVSRLNPRDNRGREALGELGLRVSNSRRPNALRWVLLLLPQGWLALLIGQIRQSVKQRRARAGLSPQLREVARREQRAAAGTRLFGTALVALVLAIVWLIARQWVIAGLALTLAIGTLAVWRSWAPAQGRRWADAVRTLKRRQRT